MDRPHVPGGPPLISFVAGSVSPTQRSARRVERMEAKAEMATTGTSHAPLRRGPWVVERVPAAAAPVHQLVEARTLHKRLPARTRPEVSGWTAGAALALTALLAVELAISLRAS